MSALRLPSVEPCSHCGLKRVRHVLLGHDEPYFHKPSEIRLMRVPLEERLATRRPE